MGRRGSRQAFKATIVLAVVVTATLFVSTLFSQQTGTRRIIGWDEGVREPDGTWHISPGPIYAPDTPPKPQPERAPAANPERTIDAGRSSWTGDGGKVLKAAYDTDKGASWDDVDCTTFMVHVLKKAGFDLSNGVEAKVQNSALGDKSDAQILDAVKHGADESKGVVNALVSSGQGREIADHHAVEAGDLIQWWDINVKEGADGPVEYAEGHASIVDRVYTNGRIGVYGSNSQTKGPGLLDGVLLDNRSQVYVVRPTLKDRP